MTGFLLILLAVVWLLGGVMFTMMLSMLHGGTLNPLEKTCAILGWPFALVLIILSFGG